jgi:hypothetical protein
MKTGNNSDLGRSVSLSPPHDLFSCKNPFLSSLCSLRSFAAKKLP